MKALPLQFVWSSMARRAISFRFVLLILVFYECMFQLSIFSYKRINSEPHLFLLTSILFSEQTILIFEYVHESHPLLELITYLLVFSLKLPSFMFQLLNAIVFVFNFLLKELLFLPKPLLELSLFCYNLLQNHLHLDL